jgi:hypothetical protein
LAEGNGADRISVSRDALRAELADLKLDLVERLTAALESKADKRLVEQVIADVNSIKEHGSPALVTAMGTIAGLDAKVDSLEGWRNRMLGALTLGLLAEPALTFLVVHYAH